MSNVNAAVPAPAPSDEDSLASWMDADDERLNDLADRVRASGNVVKGGGELPKLAPDGSLMREGVSSDGSGTKPGQSPGKQ